MSKEYLQGGEPLFLKGKEKGLLLIHGGGGGTTWDLKEFAAKANDHNYTVWLPSLPGYGTVPEDLINITVDDWLTEAREGIKRLRLIEKCSSVSIVGHSLGGLIALVLAAEDEKISRVVTWAAPWKVKSRLLPLLPFMSKLPLLRKLVPKRNYGIVPSRLKEMGWVGYDWIPTSIGFVFIKALKRLHVSISDVSCPVFVVQGTNDESIAGNSAQEIFKRLKNPQKNIWLIKNASHPLMQDSCKVELFRLSLEYLDIY
ncbi:MAG: alpha/beta hydrolase [Candidatus Hodarchaeales archaeon]|jgi:carboxylesterase